MNSDTALRRACLTAEFEDTFRQEIRLREEQLKLVKRRKSLAFQLIAQQEVEAPVLNML